MHKKSRKEQKSEDSAVLPPALRCLYAVGQLSWERLGCCYTMNVCTIRVL